MELFLLLTSDPKQSYFCLFFILFQSPGERLDWCSSLNYKTMYVVCCMFWLRMHGYLLRNQGNLDNVVLHTDPKSATLGPRLIFISKFLEKAPFLAQNA